MTVEGNAEIYTKHRDDLLRYAAVLVGPSDADDVVATVVLRAIRRRSLAELDNPRGYLFKGVLNEARGLHRRSRTLPLPEGIAGEAPPEVMDVLQAVAKLPARQRAVIYLFYWESAPVAEIAELLGVRVGTVKRYLYLGRDRLKGALR